MRDHGVTWAWGREAHGFVGEVEYTVLDEARAYQVQVEAEARGHKGQRTASGTGSESASEVRGRG